MMSYLDRFYLFGMPIFERACPCDHGYDNCAQKFVHSSLVEVRIHVHLEGDCDWLQVFLNIRELCCTCRVFRRFGMYLAGKIGIFDQRGHSWKMFPVVLPILGATFVAITRVDDYWHHWTDVCTGAAIGEWHNNSSSSTFKGVLTPICNLGLQVSVTLRLEKVHTRVRLTWPASSEFLTFDPGLRILFIDLHRLQTLWSRASRSCDKFRLATRLCKSSHLGLTIFLWIGITLELVLGFLSPLRLPSVYHMTEDWISLVSGLLSAYFYYRQHFPSLFDDNRKLPRSILIIQLYYVDLSYWRRCKYKCHM